MSEPLTTPIGAVEPAIWRPSAKDRAEAGRKALARKSSDGDARRPRVYGYEAEPGEEISIVPSDRTDAVQRAIVERWTTTGGYTVVTLADRITPARFRVDGFTSPCMICVREIVIGRQLRVKHLATR